MELKVIDLFSGYGTSNVLIDITLTAREGKITSIIGSNGAGKTTLLSTVSGLIRHRRGKIFASELEVSELATSERVKLGIVLCPERRRLFPSLTAIENIKLGAYLRKDKQKVEADLEYVLSLFPVLRQRMNQQAGTLSGGEQQMVAIARSLMSNPKILLLDEPSVGLSPMMREKIFSAIVELNKSKKITVVLVEQDAADALSISDYSYVLEGGRIVLEGDSRDLVNNENVRKAYLGL